jgi:hypothetical protein
MAAPDLSIDKIGKNPFTEGLEIKVIKKSFTVLNKFEKEDVKEYELEAVPYTKVFEVTGNKKEVNDLPVRCKEMYLWLIHTIKSGQDIVWIDRARYMAKMKIKSSNTYKEAVRVLCENLYMYPHANPGLRDVYWINPRFIFKGSRLHKYPDNLIVKAVVKQKK